LQERTITPEWKQIRSWFADDHETLEGLRLIVNQKKICWIEGELRKRRLMFRHDRIRDALFARLIRIQLHGGDISEDVLSEPYYAEVIGQALTLSGLAPECAQKVAEANTLALFCAFSCIHEPSTTFHQAVVDQIRKWIKNDMMTGKCLNSLKWEVERVLMNTDSPLVLEFTSNFDRGHNVNIARLRNGDIESGVRLCIDEPPEVNYPYRDRVIAHAKTRFGRALIDQLLAILRHPNNSDHLRIGALNLAGHLADASLAHAVLDCWQHAENKKLLLPAAIWAGARCCGSDPEHWLTPLFKFWQTLSDEIKEWGTSDRTNVAEKIMHAIAKGISGAALGFFISHAGGGSPLEWPLSLIL
jgi:hypothetical protein